METPPAAVPVLYYYFRNYTLCILPLKNENSQLIANCGISIAVIS